MEFFPFGFDNTKQTGSTELLGGKGAGLLWLANEGVPVPPGFVIPTSVWTEYDKKPKGTMKEIAKALPEYLAKLEAHFGYLPLLSVRSGARVSCPGMMDTILNVGLDGSNFVGWTNRLGPKCFADSLNRLVSMYGSVVDSLDKESLKDKNALDAYTTQTGKPFPDATGQLLGAIEAVFKSWDNDRANEYRKMNGYAREWGTAVTVQAMVFGNLNEKSATGVLFTRNPDTGRMAVTGEWLPESQGEDIVAGTRTPLSLDSMKEWNPILHDELLDWVIKLENLRKDMLDIEWTIQDGKLYLLQVRNGKRSALAAIKIATDMAKQGLIDAKTAIKRVSVKQFDLAQLAQLDPKFTTTPAFTGIGACSGIVSGKPVFTKEAAIECKEPCILIRQATEPSDIAGMKAAKGVITMVGGLTSHAAVVARGMDRACVVGVGAPLDAFKDATVVSLDGATGRIWLEAVPIINGTTNGAIDEFNALVCKTLGVVPVVFDVPNKPLPEALFYLGDKVLNPTKAVEDILATLAKVDRLYLDLVPSDEELKYLSILSGHDYTAQLLGKLHQAIPVGHKDFGRIVLVAEGQVSPFKRVALGADLRALVLADGEFVAEGLDTTDPAIKQVLQWKQAEGLKAISLGAYVPGCKSLISVPQALQILAEAS